MTIGLQIEVADSINGLGVGREQQSGHPSSFPRSQLLRHFRTKDPQPSPGSDVAHRHQVGSVDFDSSIELLQLEESLGRLPTG